MLNYAYQNRERLSTTHYVRLASPHTDYWVDFSYSKLKRLVETETEFFLIIIGNKTRAGDFYAIPFNVVSHLFTLDSLYQKPRKRWIASILHHQFRVRRAPVSVDVGAFYGAVYLLNLDSLRDGEGGVSEQEQNEYAIENRKIEIEARQRQSVFRSLVLENFNGRCCISGISETDLLVASHIVPWADKIDSRLDPGNGLCLFVLYDKLFDLGYISLNDQLQVIVADSIDLSPELHRILQSIEGKTIAEPVKFPIKLEYIRYHRENIFRGEL